MLSPTSNSSSERNQDESGNEARVERLVAEISRVIQSAEPTTRAGLKELAETLLHEEITPIAEEPQSLALQPTRSRFNPLAPGVLLILLGMGLFIIVPFIGAALGLIGLALALWGGMLSFMKK